MHVIKSFFIALSIYSKVPVPQFDWKEEDMRYTLCFFPLVGVMIALFEWLWYWLCTKYQIGTVAFATIGTAIPVMISGGFHVDGYMDTMDALHSYKPREKKLEILKDPHIGAFSVIMLVLYYLIYLGAYSEIHSKETFLCFVTGFVLSRAFSAVGVLFLKPAKENGMLSYFSKTVQKRIVAAAVFLELLLCFLWMFLINHVLAVIIFMTAVLVYIYYVIKSKKEFGGITGDLAGYFVTICELCIVVVTMIFSVIY